MKEKFIKGFVWVFLITVVTGYLVLVGSGGVNAPDNEVRKSHYGDYRRGPSNV